MTAVGKKPVLAGAVTQPNARRVVFDDDRSPPLDAIEGKFNDGIRRIKIGRIDGKFVAYPTFEEIIESDLDLVMAGSRDAILTVESNSKEVSEEVILEALEWGQNAIQPLIDAQEKMAQELGKTKKDYQSYKISEDLKKQVHEKAIGSINDILGKEYEKVEFRNALDTLRDQILEEYAENEEIAAGDVNRSV